MTLQSLTFNNTVGVRDELSIQDCNDLVTLSFPQLLMVGGDVNLGNLLACTSLTMPTLAVVGGDLEVSISSITSLDLPALTRVGGSFNPTFLSQLTTFSADALLTVGSFQPSNMPLITAISLPSLTTIWDKFSPGHMASLVEFELPALTRVGSISFDTGTDALTTFTLSSELQSVQGDVSFTSCALDVASVDGLLASLAALDGTSGTTLFENHTVTITGTSAGPSNDGAADLTTLQGRGNTVVTNAGSGSVLTAAITETGSATSTVDGNTAGFPGQVGNPVGHAAAPGFTSLTPSGITPVSGSSGSPQVYNFLDFDKGTGGLELTAGQDWITFNGCRFQSNSAGNYNVQINGATHIIFNFCSFTPRTALVTSPPGAAWPSAGLNGLFQENGINCTDGTAGYQYGLNILSGGPVAANSCDFWGFGNGGPLFYSTTSAMLVNNCWIHDPCYSGSIVTQATASSTASTTISVTTGGISAGFIVLPFQFCNTTALSTNSTTLTLDSTSDIGVGWTLVGSGITGAPTVVSITDGTHLVMSSTQTVASGVQITFSFASAPTVVSVTDASHLVVSSSLSVPNGASLVFSLLGSQGYHEDGTGYLNGGVPPSNVTIQNCTIAGILNTNCLAWQGGTAAFNNINHIGNYLTGGGYTAFMANTSSPDFFTNSVFTNNTFGTDIPWTYGPLRSDYTANYTTASERGNTWSGNKIKIVNGSVQSPQSYPLTWTTDQNGQFIWPDSSLHTTDFVP